MSLEVDIIEENLEHDILQDVLKNIVGEVEPQYEERLVVGYYEEETMDEWGVPIQISYIAKKRGTIKLFGFIPIHDGREEAILTVNELFLEGKFGKREVYMATNDKELVGISRKHFEQYSEQLGIKSINIKVEA